MKAKVTWEKRLSFIGTADTGFSIPLGASPAVGGDDDGFRPMELILIGLAGCTAMDVISILNKKKQNITAFEVKTSADRSDEHPKVFQKILIEYIITGHDVDPAAVKRAIELTSEKYCPAQAMLGKSALIEIKMRIINEE